jgi:FkbM family methyltransferase
MSLRNRVTSLISRHYGNLPFSAITAVCEKYLRAYYNAANWDIPLNGEGYAISFVLDKFDGDVLDVGANFGDWAIAALPHLRPGQKIHCFEVVPQLRETLAENLKPWGSSVVINDFGVGANDGSEQINFDQSVHTITSKFPLIYSDASPCVITARICTGDTYLRAAEIRRVAMIKVDVEGMEMEVSSGFSDSFAQGMVSAVQFEHGPSHVLSGHTLRDFVSFFEQIGFEVYEMFPNKVIKLEYRFSKENYDGRNFLALKSVVRA